jgi:MFS family permease
MRVFFLRGAGVVRPSFRDARFALLVAGEGVNSVGGWASAVVLWGFTAYRFGAGADAVAMTIVCWAAPPALLSPLLGVYIDRVGPKAALIAGYCGAAGAAVGMAAAGSLAGLDIAAVGYGIARALAGPAASALPPRIVAGDDLLAANALLGSASQAGQVAGPLAASAVLALSGFPAAFFVDAASYLVGAAVVAPLPAGPAQLSGRAQPSGSAPASRPRGWARELAEGLALISRNRGLRLVATLSAGVAFTSGAFLVVEPLYARHVLNRPASQFALFEAAIGIGAIVTGLALPVIRRRVPAPRSPGRLLAAGAISCGLAAALFTGTPWVPVAYLGAFAWGVGDTVFYAAAATTLQRLAPAGALGRVSGMISTAESTTESISMPVAGALVAVAGLRPGALVLAAVAAGAGAAWLLG